VPSLLPESIALRNDQPARVICAQKANTASSLSLDSTSSSGGSGQPNGLALSTASLYSAVQPGSSGRCE
jgi:hypothetical protein